MATRQMKAGVISRRQTFGRGPGVRQALTFFDLAGTDRKFSSSPRAAASPRGARMQRGSKTVMCCKLFWILIPALARSPTVEVYKFNLRKPWPVPFDALAP